MGCPLQCERGPEAAAAVLTVYKNRCTYAGVRDLFPFGKPRTGRRRFFSFYWLFRSEVTAAAVDLPGGNGTEGWRGRVAIRLDSVESTVTREAVAARRDLGAWMVLG